MNRLEVSPIWPLPQSQAVTGRAQLLRLREAPALPLGMDELISSLRPVRLITLRIYPVPRGLTGATCYYLKTSKGTWPLS